MGSGQQTAVGGGAVPALGAAAPADPGPHIKAALGCNTTAELTKALAAAQAAGFAIDLTDEDDLVAQAFMGRRHSLVPQTAQAEPPPAPQVPAAPLAEQAANAEGLWSQIVAAAGGAGFDLTSDIEEAFIRVCHTPPTTASPEQMAEFLRQMQAGQIRPGPAPAPVTTPAGPSPSEEEIPF